MVIDDPYASLIEAENGECSHDPGLAGDLELAINDCDRELFQFELRHCWRTL